MKKFNPKPIVLRTNGIHTLEISREYDDDPKDIYPVFLFTPIKGGFDHYHIALTKGKAKALRDWLNKYLDEVE